MARSILAIDQATRTGWALLHNGELTSGVIFLPRSLPSVGPGVRFLAFERELEERFGMFKPNQLAIVHEQPFVSDQIKAMVVVAGLVRHLEAWAHRHKYDVRAVHNMTVKKYACGSGHATKPQMLRNARLKWPDQEIIDDNQADALWILDYAIYGES